MPAQAIETLAEIGPFLGLDTWTSHFYLSPGFLTDLSNIDFTVVKGAVVLSRGRQVFNTSDTSATITGLGRFPDGNAGLPLTLIAKGTTWSYMGDAAVTDTSIALPYAWTNAQTRFATLDRVLIGMNGVERPIVLIKDTPGTAQAAGINTPVTTPTIAVSAGVGNLSGSYRYRVTFESSTHESSPGPATVLLVFSNNSANLTNIPVSAESHVGFVNIYRLGGGVPEWRFVGQVANGVTTANDDVLDENLGQLLVFDRDPPPAGLAYPVQHKSKIIAIKDNNLYVSNFGTAEGWNPTSVFPVGDSGNIVGIASTGSILLILKGSHAFGLWGYSEEDFQILPISPHGCVSPSSIASAAGFACWLSDDGIRVFDGQSSTYLGNALVKGLIDGLSLAVRRTAVGTFGLARYLLSFPGHFTIEYNFLTQQFTKYAWTFDQVTAAFEDNGPEQFLVTDGALSKRIRKWPGPNQQDLSLSQAWYFERADLPEAGIGTYYKGLQKGDDFVKRYREVIIAGPRQSGVNATLTLTVDGDVVDKIYTRVFSLTNLPIRLGLPDNMIGKRITVRISGSHSIPVQIDRIRLRGWIERAYSLDAQ